MSKKLESVEITDIEKRRLRVEQLFIFTDRYVVNHAKFKGVKVGKQYLLDNEYYEVIAISKNQYLKQEYVFLNNVNNILPF
jgi:hypothetical protein